LHDVTGEREPGDERAAKDTTLRVDVGHARDYERVAADRDVVAVVAEALEVRVRTCW
jgi:hypothetical protein